MKTKSTLSGKILAGAFLGLTSLSLADHYINDSILFDKYEKKVENCSFAAMAAYFAYRVGRSDEKQNK